MARMLKLIGDEDHEVPMRRSDMRRVEGAHVEDAEGENVRVCR